MKSFYKILGKNIKEARLYHDYNQIDLARALGHDSSTFISLIESGKRQCSVEDLVNICKYFRISINKLLGSLYKEKK